MDLQEKYKSLLNSYYVNTSLRVAHFMAQIDFYFVSLLKK